MKQLLVGYHILTELRITISPSQRIGGLRPQKILFYLLLYICCFSTKKKIVVNELYLRRNRSRESKRSISELNNS